MLMVGPLRTSPARAGVPTRRLMPLLLSMLWSVLQSNTSEANLAKRIGYFVRHNNGILDFRQPPYGFETREAAVKWAENRYIQIYDIIEDYI
jgi:hypothetical protein